MKARAMPSALWQDARYAFRMLLQNPGFTAVAILSLALGIGANTAIFSLLDAILLESLPVRSPRELVILARNPARPATSHNYPDYVYLREHSRSYSGLVAYGFGAPVGLTAEGQGSAQLASLCMVSGNYFEVLGVTPAVGRLFNDEDNKTEGAHPYAVLSHAYWQRAFGGDPNVIGRQVRINNAPFSVVGVAQAGFTGAEVGAAPDLFAPIVMMRSVNPSFRNWNTRNFWWLTVMGRLRPGVTLQQASAENEVLRQQILAADPNRRPAPAWDKDRDARERGLVLPGAQGSSFFRREAATPLIVLMIVVALVLLIACANVANLLLARAAGRQREIAIRLAVGAGRGRLVMQLLVESLMLALLGGATGVALAWVGARALLRLMPSRGPFPMALDVSPDARVLLFAFAVALFAGIVFGLVPALRATRPDLVSWLKGEIPETVLSRLGFRRFDLRRALVTVQVALSILLLVGAGLFVRSLRNLRDLDPGFRRENVLVVRTDPSQNGYNAQRLRTFHERLLEDARSLPGVRSAGMASITPLGGMRWNSDVAVEGYQRKPEERPVVDMNAVSPRFFETLGIPILLGRDFRAEDSPAVSVDPPEKRAPGQEFDPGGPRVAIVNEAFARHYFGGRSAIGKRYTPGDKFVLEKSYEIIGVVGNARYFGLREAVGPMIYYPVWRQGPDRMGLFVRTTGDPQRLIEAIRRQVADIDAAIPVQQARTMEQFLDDNMVAERLVATLCGIFGGLALVLASVGLYGVMAHAVARRTREIGIRMALGAPRAGVMRMVLGDALLMVAAGVVIGLPAALALSRYVASLLYGIGPQDPATVALSVVVLAAVTLAATWAPARRATRVDPAEALRYE